MSTNEPSLTTKGSVAEVLRPIRSQLIFAAILAAIGSALTLVPLACIAHIGQLVLNREYSQEHPWLQTYQHVWQIIGVSLGCLLLAMFLLSVAETVAHLADNRITQQLRLSISRRLSKVALGWFTERASGEVKQALQDDINQLHNLTAHFYTTLGRTLGAVLASTLYMFVLDWRMALVSLLPFSLFFLFFFRASKDTSENLQTFAANMARINNAVVEFINGIPVIKAFAIEGKSHASYRQAVDSFAVAFSDFVRPRINAIANAHALLTPIAVLAVILAFGTVFVHLKWIAATDILPFVLLAPGLCAPLLLLSYVMHDLNNASGAAQRIYKLLHTPVLETLPGAPLTLPADAKIEVEHLCYSYDSKTPVLDDISFTLKPATVTAIVGASGSGKSTLARLLLRFFDPTDGSIRIGGSDLRQLDSSTLYRHIGFVLQDVRLIHASLRDNIALGRPSASQQEIEDAARLANIHECIKALPRGYDSVIGEDAQLSGGEMQRVSIARAVLLDPPVLVLDEATAAADAENEVQIQQALSLFAQGRSVLVIAHRLDTVMHADQIIVLDKGRIHEQGSHSQLLANQDLYARLWALGGYETTLKEQSSC